MKQPSPPRGTRSKVAVEPIPPMPDPEPLPHMPKGFVGLSSLRPTGRKLMLLAEGGARASGKVLSNKAGLKWLSSREIEGDRAALGAASGLTIMFESLGVALCSADPDQWLALAAAEREGGISRIIEDERRVTRAVLPPGWVMGYQAGVTDLCGHLLRAGTATEPAAIRAQAGVTWACALVGADRSRLDGGGVKLAILDTGMDFSHPDFAGRVSDSASFVEDEAVQDGNGHGTHCAGVACGPLRPASGERYGVAPGAELFVGKVLSNLGEGTDGGILAGMEWAVRSGCHIVSMSLGAPGGGAFSRIYETAARRALARNTLIVAAAGNDSNRPGIVAPVSHPANCPSIMAVGAVDQKMGIARFSNSSADIVGPGVGVVSAWPGARAYRQESGTSMATPHVAGIAALMLQANPELSAEDLLRRLKSMARALPQFPVEDVGAGLVQAP